jgi:hypothetical protein
MREFCTSGSVGARGNPGYPTAGRAFSSPVRVLPSGTQLLANNLEVPPSREPDHGHPHSSTPSPGTRSTVSE